jgi:hypothetical protein
VATTHAVRVSVDQWARAFDVLGAAGLPVTLAGTTVRVADVPAARVEQVLADAGMVARVESVPATIEERMTVLAAAAPEAR